ncbi:hypothetical protein [Methanobrevibacter curvatus]|uniref:PepSY domain-containing protein n=1 Tax=Methanobrevibacter curvatus TaxID=49547 RepID=A0A162FC35_9EURY|nr:hypothetical protein [Methanobrevibacter curvatus]KZX10815.1 hypothetical protein MBCUR_16650 [Methanobrevibacter curvatus]
MNNKKIILFIIFILLLISGIAVFNFIEDGNSNGTVSNDNTNTKNSSTNNTNLTETANNTKISSSINNTNDYAKNNKKYDNKKYTHLTQKEAIEKAKNGVDPLSQLGKKAYYKKGFWKIPIYDEKTGEKMGYVTVSDKTGDVVGSVSHSY